MPYDSTFSFIDNFVCYKKSYGLIIKSQHINMTDKSFQNRSTVCNIPYNAFLTGCITLACLSYCSICIFCIWLVQDLCCVLLFLLRVPYLQYPSCPHVRMALRYPSRRHISSLASMPHEIIISSRDTVIVTHSRS